MELSCGWGAAGREEERAVGERVRAGGRAAPAGCLIRSWSSRPSGGGSRRSTSWRSSRRLMRARGPGEVGELLRREGLYTSHLTSGESSAGTGRWRGSAGRGGVSRLIGATRRSRSCRGGPSGPRPSWRRRGR